MTIPIWIAYYGISEGLSGASVGKRMVRLRVIDSAGQPPGVARASWRAVVFTLTPSIPFALPQLFLGQTRMLQLFVESPVLLRFTVFVTFVVVGLLFSTARRRNGFAGIHDP